MAEHDTTVSALVAEAHKLIEILLRYVASGATALAAFGIVQGRSFDFLRGGSPSSEVSGWLVLLFVASIGTVIYTVHQAVLFRFVHLFLFSLLGFFQTPRVGPIELADELRDIRLVLRKSGDPWARVFDSWAAECHFLYCSAWGVLAAVALANLIAVPSEMPSKVCLVVGVALLVAAVIHDGAAARKHLNHRTKTSAT